MNFKKSVKFYVFDWMETKLTLTGKKVNRDEFPREKTKIPSRITGFMPNSN